jgi:hypothetical protein
MQTHANILFQAKTTSKAAVLWRGGFGLTTICTSLPRTLRKYIRRSREKPDSLPFMINDIFGCSVPKILAASI